MRKNPVGFGFGFNFYKTEEGALKEHCSFLTFRNRRERPAASGSGRG